MISPFDPSRSSLSPEERRALEAIPSLLGAERRSIEPLPATQAPRTAQDEAFDRQVREARFVSEDSVKREPEEVGRTLDSVVDRLDRLADLNQQILTTLESILRG